MAEEPREMDETRLCPVCRMPISILATRCRYCGEEVGRPRKETETLTIKDLGGEEHTTYTLSGDVLGALESFRAEVLAEQEQERRDKEALSASWFAKRGPESAVPLPRAASDPGLPELDAAHRDLADIAGSAPAAPRHATPRPQPRRQSPEIPKKLFIVGAIAAALVLLYLGTDFTWAKIKEYQERRNTVEKIVYHSKGLEYLEHGRPAIDALEESMDAVKADNSPENQEILQKVRREFIASIRAMTRKDPWQQADYDEAARLVNRAIQKDSDRSIVDLLEEVNKEVAAYRIILTGLDPAAGTANFRINDPSFPQRDQTVSVGDYVQDRFVVKRISQDGVSLEDTKAPVGQGYRRLKAGLTRPLVNDTASIVGVR